MNSQDIKNFLIASADNGYEPGILKAKTIGFLIVFFFLFQVAVALLATRQQTEASDLTTSNILAAVNREREMRNLTTLATHASLSAAGQSKADDMIARHYFSHTDPEGNYVWPKIVAAGYSPYLQLGENLAIEFYNTESLVSAWMNSPTHRANILNDGFRDQGMGLSFGDGSASQYHSAIVNTFGALLAKKPSAPAPEPAQIAPAPEPKPATTKPATKPKPVAQVPTQPTPKPSTPAATTPAIPSSTPVSAKPSRTISFNQSTLQIAGTVKGSQLHLNVSVEVAGPPDTVIASVADRTVMLQRSASSTSPTAATFEGIVPLPESINTASSTLKLLAQDSRGYTSLLEYPLKDISLQAPVSTGTPDAVTPKAPASSRSVPYTANRYITLAFGSILLVLLLSDAWIVLEKRLNLIDKKANNLIVLIIALLVVAFMYWM